MSVFFGERSWPKICEKRGWCVGFWFKDLERFESFLDVDERNKSVDVQFW